MCVSVFQQRLADRDQHQLGERQAPEVECEQQDLYLPWTVGRVAIGQYHIADAGKHQDDHADQGEVHGFAFVAAFPRPVRQPGRDNTLAG